MKAVVTVVGRDKVGIIAMASGECAKFGVNILDISQTVMNEYFTMVMLVDITSLKSDFAAMQRDLYALGDQIGMKIHVMHEEIFESMHHI